VKRDLILSELKYKAVRSGGPGGQHVNKVSTKIELYFDVLKSNGLSENEKERIVTKLSNQLSKEHVLVVKCDDGRSQLKNKSVATKRFFDLIVEALKVPKKRRATKPSRASIENRLKAKKRASAKKATRGKPDLDSSY